MIEMELCFITTAIDLIIKKHNIRADLTMNYYLN
jgi:hypothetical protein